MNYNLVKLIYFMIPYFYGSIIIGPSGVGKTTLCKGLA